MILKKYQPLFDRVLIEVIEEEEKQSKTGLIMPIEKKEDAILTGTVVAVGDGRWNEDGDERIALSVAVGDTVLFSKYGFDEVMIDEKTYLIGREDQLLAVCISAEKTN